MKIICFFLLVAGPFCVRGQLPLGGMTLPPAGSAIPKWEPGTKREPGQSLVMPGPAVLFPDTAFETGRIWLGQVPREFGSGSALVLQGDRVVRLLAPDRMPCVVPNMRRVEGMPVDRRGNADKMVYGGRRVLRIF